MLELQKMNEKIQKFTLNKNHIKSENDYIKNLIVRLNIYCIIFNLIFLY